MQFGLLGKNISYSFSQKYFSQKFTDLHLTGYNYSIFDLADESKFPLLFEKDNLKGFNVTIPYKESIIKYLDELSPEAVQIGAVNTVKIENGKKKGFNTDAVGFRNSFEPLLKSHHTSALILGSGGASKAVSFVLKQLDIEYLIISRSGVLNYESLNEEIINSHFVIINTTPVGTFPNVNLSPLLPFEFLTEKHLVYDLIYNPEETLFLKQAKKKGAKIKNGLEMLHLQAEAAWEIWNK